MQTVIRLIITMFLIGAFTNAAAEQRTEPFEPQLAVPTTRPVKNLKADKSATVLRTYTFDQGGSADAEGWVALDKTAGYRPFIHVDDHLPPLNGSKSLWCGAIAHTDDPATSDWPHSGYGNRWNQSWVSRAFTTTSSDSTVFSCQIQWDLDDTFGSDDFIEFEFRIDNGPWLSAQYYANSSGAETLRAARLLPVGSTIEYRFTFKSDDIASNADGYFSTPGAFLVDDLLVENGLGNVLSYEDFESEAIGAITTNSGDWHAESAPGFGLYANMFSGSLVRQDDPSTYNSSHFWTFFSGSLDQYNCSEPYPATPTGGVAYGDILDNEIQSPWIVINQTFQPTSIRVNYDAYLDSPFETDNYSTYHQVTLIYRDLSGQFNGSQTTPAYYGTFASWIQMSHQFFLPAGTSSVQVVFKVAEYIDSACHRHAPLIDNVVVSQTDAITVTTLGSAGAGSLYWAINTANAQPGLSVIEFDIPANDWIVLDNALPPITKPVHILGSTTTGSTPNTLTGANDAVIMTRLRSSYGDAFPALDIQADDCVIEGLAFKDFTHGDLRIAGNNNTVRGCWLGSDPDGSFMSPSFSPRIVLSDAGSGSPDFIDNTIGGSVPADHNVVGNSNDSAIEAINQNSLTIRGNLIGLKPNGQTASGAKHGIELSFCEDALIQDNVISGNTRTPNSHGIYIYRGGDHDLRSNIIGLSGNQLLAVPNSGSGVEYQGSSGTTLIGGANPEHGNIIAANGGNGIRISEEGTVGVYYNAIGTNAAGYWTHLGNGGNGVLMEYSLGVEVEIGEQYGANIIAHNDGAGIKVGEFMSDTFLFRANSIYHNDGPEIDFSLWSGTPVPAPTLTDATLHGLTMVVVGELNGDPNDEYIVDFYANRNCSNPGDPDATDHIGSALINTDGSGFGPFTYYAPEDALPNDTVTAIASRWLDNGTSAVSNCVQSINTAVGADVVVNLPVENEPTLPITATFDLVTTAGNTSVIYADDCGAAPIGYQVLGYYEISTTAIFEQNATFCFAYDGTGLAPGIEAGMMVLQGVDDPGNPFLDITGGQDPANDTICGVINSFDPYPSQCVAVVAPLYASAVQDQPGAFKLLPNYPNPFNPSTTISFELPRDVDQLTVDVYDVSGRRVRRLHSGSAQSGRTELVWNGTDEVGRAVVSGVYLVRVLKGAEGLTQRLLLLK